MGTLNAEPAVARRPRWATWLCAGGALGSVICLIFLVAGELEPPGDTSAARSAPGVRLYRSSVLLAITVAALVAFLVGSYVIVRVGRSVAPRRGREPRSVYSDAWSQVRVTPEQIEAATRESDDPQPPRTP